MEKLIHSKIVYKCSKFSVEEAIIELPNGIKANRYYIIKPDFIGIIPVDNDGNILLIKEYRSAYGDYIWGIPGGARNTDEKPSDAAHRELREETNIDCNELKLFFESKSSHATIKEYNYFFVGKDLFNSPKRKTEWEDIVVLPHNHEEVLKKILSGSFQEKIAFVLLHYLREHDLKIHL